MKLNITKGIFALSLLASALVACKKINPTAGVATIVDGTFSQATVSFQFIDAKTGIQLDLNNAEAIQVSVTGKNAADVVNNVGGTSITAGSGIMAVGLRFGVTPSTSNVVEFSVHATANGYLSIDKTVTIVQTGHQHFEVQMIKFTDTPSGVSASQGTVSGVPSSGATVSTFTLSPSLVAASGTTASVTIPAGTTLMDANNVAVSGDVNTTLIYFNPNDDIARQSFPSGLMNSKLSTGENVLFNTLGWVSMQMVTASGTEVKNFDTPIQMTMSIPDGKKDSAGNVITAGMSFGIYSHNDGGATWKHESDAVVQLNGGTGKLEVTFNMTHLSDWQAADKNSLYGAESINQITFKGDCPYYFNNTSDIIRDYISSSLGVESSEIALINLNKPTYIIGKSPVYVGVTAKFRWYKKNNPSDFIEASAENNVSSTVQLPASWCEPVKEFTIKLTTSCPDNPSRQIKPQCFVMAFEEGQFSSKWIPVGQMLNGVLKTSTGVLKKNKRYTLVSFYQGKFVALTGDLGSFNFGAKLIDGNDIDLSRPLTDAECTYLRKIVG